MPSLTPLRGIAALWVVLYHYDTQVFPNLPIDRYTQLVTKGYLAVDLFFLLSGFVITHVYRRAFSARVGANSYWDFLSARIARLYPAHVVVLFLFLAATVALHVAMFVATGSFTTIPLDGPRSWLAFIANLFMVQGLHASALSWNFPEWSVSLEFVAYLAFPFLLPRVWSARPAAKVALAALALAALAVIWQTEPDFDRWDGPEALLRCLPEFLLGCLLYDLYRSEIGATALASDRVLITIVVLTVLMIHRGAADFFLVLCFAGLVLAAVANRGRAAALVNSRAFVWLGDVSYSLYLLHGFVQFLVAELLSDAFGIADPERLSIAWALIITAAMLAMSFALASLSYRYVEVEGRRFLRAILQGQRPVLRRRASPNWRVFGEPHFGTSRTDNESGGLRPVLARYLDTGAAKRTARSPNLTD